MDRRENQFLAQRPQEAGVVYRAGGEGHRLLGRLLQRSHPRKTAHPKSLEPLPLGNPTLTSAMTYWRKLLSLYADRLVSLRWPKGKVIGQDKMSL